MKRMVSWYFVVLVSFMFVFYSCSTTPGSSSSSSTTGNTSQSTSSIYSSSSSSSVRKPGEFSIAQLGLSRNTRNSVQNIFYLGNLKNSQSYYFLLQNTGGYDISNITLTSDNPAFSISPSSILVLQTGSSTLIPILTVGITHGTSLNGVGSAALLPMGTNSSIFHLNGTSLDSLGNVTNITGNFSCSINSLVMDIILSNSNSILLPSAFFGSPNSPIISVPAKVQRYFLSNQSDYPFDIINSGNVPISIKFYWLNSNTALYDIHEDKGIINPESKLSNIYQKYPEAFTNAYYDQGPFLIVINGQSTICDQNKYTIGNDGCIYLVVGIR